MSYRLARSAARDIDEIADRIDLRDPASALRFVEALHEVFGLLSERPLIGHSRPDITDRPVRFWTALRRYAVIYEAGPPTTIIHVRDWRRNPADLLEE
jgi:plasmid stabilization system protein ParE